MQTHIILLVEDSPDDVDLTIRALSKSDFATEVIVTRDGAEALEYLFAKGRYANRDLAAIPSVVLLDLKLPKVDGLQVLSRMRAHESTKRLPVVVFTSSSETEDIVHSYDLGANSFVRKPVDFDRFLEAARQISAFWLGLNELAPASPERAVQHY